MCCNGLLMACISVFIKCSIMPKSYLCTHVCSSAFPCLFSGHFMVCVPLHKKEQGANVCMKGRGNMCMCVVASAPQRFTPPLSRPSAESPKSQMATAHRQAHTDTHTEQDAELSWGQSQQMSWSELACCVF